MPFHSETGVMRDRIEKKLQRFGVSGPSREWLMRALHPASGDKSPGLPDPSSAFVLRPDYRIQATILPPPDNPGGSWDCFMWIPPGDVNALYWATGPGGTDFSTTAAPAYTQCGVIRLQPSGDHNFAMGYYDYTDASSHTAYANTPVINSAAFRHQFKSVTVTLIAAAVADQGQVYAAQYSPLIRRNGMVIPNGYPNPGGNALVAGYYQTVLPADETALAATAPQFYMDAAREGVYMPLRLAGPSQPFARTVAEVPISLQTGHMGLFTADYSQFRFGAILTPTTNPDEDAGSTLPWVFRAPTVDASAISAGQSLVGYLNCDSGYDNVNSGVMIWRGLSGGAGQFTSSLQVKVIAGLEIVPNPAASDRVFAEPPAPYDPKALEAYYELCVDLKDAYPASYNSLDDILNAIGSAASRVFGVFEPALKQAAPILLERAIGGLGGSPGTFAPRAPALRVAYRAPSTARSTTSKSRSMSAKRPATKVAVLSRRAKARVRVR
jgi:hypothetical protein